MRNMKILKFYAFVGLIFAICWGIFLIFKYPFYKINKYFSKSKLIISLICLSITGLSNGQNISGIYNVDIHNNFDEVFPEVTKSFLISGTAYFTAYEICFKNTNLTQNECRLIGVGSALLAGFTLSAFEQNQHNNLGYNMYGSMFAAFSFTITIGEDKKRDARRKLVNL